MNPSTFARIVARELRSGVRVKQDCGKCAASGWMGGEGCDACGGKGWTAVPATPPKEP